MFHFYSNLLLLHGYRQAGRSHGSACRTFHLMPGSEYGITSCSCAWPWSGAPHLPGEPQWSACIWQEKWVPEVSFLGRCLFSGKVSPPIRTSDSELWVRWAKRGMSGCRGLQIRAQRGWILGWALIEYFVQYLWVLFCSVCQWMLALWAAVGKTVSKS